MAPMANFYLEVQVISRSKGRSVTRLVNYISGKRLHDPYQGEAYYKWRNDILCIITSFSPPTPRLSSIIFSISATLLRVRSAAMMPGLRGSLRVTCQTSFPNRS